MMKFYAWSDENKDDRTEIHFPGMDVSRDDYQKLQDHITEAMQSYWGTPYVFVVTQDEYEQMQLKIK